MAQTRRLRRYPSIPRVAGGSREGDGVAHISEAGDVGEGALEAEAEAGMRHRAIAAQIAVPGVALFVDVALRHARLSTLDNGARLTTALPPRPARWAALRRSG